MQSNHTSKIPEDARLSRRRFLAGAVVLPAVVAAPALADAAAIEDNYDELVMLIDQRDEMQSQHIAAIRAFEAIDYLRDQPPREPRIGALKLFGNEHLAEYYLGGIIKVFSFNAEHLSFHDYFEEQIDDAISRARLRSEFAHWPEVKAHDYRRVTAELRKQLEARQRWEEASGYLAADAEMNRSLESLLATERKICILPVLSFRDLRLKLDLAAGEKWDVDSDNLRLILASIKDFAGPDELANRRLNQGLSAADAVAFDGSAAILRFQAAIANSPGGIWRGGGWVAKAEKDGDFVLIHRERANVAAQ